MSSGSQVGPGSNKDVPSFKNADDAQKSALVKAEVQRMKRPPMAGSAYATDRLVVLNKMLQLLGKVRTSTEGEELELLFANLNF